MDIRESKEYYVIVVPKEKYESMEEGVDYMEPTYGYVELGTGTTIEQGRMVFKNIEEIQRMRKILKDIENLASF